MSRFVDRNATERKTLGSCECPNAPHGEDWIEIRKVISYNDMLYLNDVSAQQGVAEAMWVVFNLRVADWNLVDDKGKKIPLSRRTWNDLDEQSAERITELIKLVSEPSEEIDPNSSGAPSPS